MKFHHILIAAGLLATSVSSAAQKPTLDLKQLVDLGLVQVQANIRSGSQPRWFLYEFDARPTQKLFDQFSIDDDRDTVVAELRVGTVISGVKGIEAVVAANQNVYFTDYHIDSDKPLTVRTIKVFALGLGEEFPTGDLKLKALSGPARYVLFDDVGGPLLEKRAMENHHRAQQVALLLLSRSFSNQGYESVYGNDRSMELTPEMRTNSEGYVKRANAKHAENSAYFAQLKTRLGSEPQAMIELAETYLAGQRGLPRDRGAAARWYLKASEAGSDIAKHQLALLYSKRLPPGPDLEMSKAWLVQAAEAGFIPALIGLGDAHRTGWASLEPNANQARLWYEKAAAKGSETARSRLEHLDRQPQRDALGIGLGLVAAWMFLNADQQPQTPGRNQMTQQEIQNAIDQQIRQEQIRKGIPPRGN